jgi:hypothetical protein
MNVLTYNIKLEFKCKEDKESLINLLLEHQKVWNHMSEYVFNSKVLDKKLIHDKNYHQCRNLFPECPSQVIIRAKDSIYATYKTIKSNHQEITESAKQENLSIRLDKRLYTFLHNNQIKLTTTGKRIICHYKPYVNLPKGTPLAVGVVKYPVRSVVSFIPGPLQLKVKLSPPMPSK